MAREMDDVSELSDHGSENGYRMSHLGEVRNSFQDHGSPVIHNLHSDQPTYIPSGGSGYHSTEKVPLGVRGWPQGPRPLQKYRGWGYLALFIDVLVTFLPVIFLRL